MAVINRRVHKRFAKNCKIEFLSDGIRYYGVSRDFALNGLFITTRDPKVPGTILEVIIHLPDGSTLKLRAKVMRIFKTLKEKGTGTPIKAHKDGMGVEIIEKNVNYLHFFRSLLCKRETEKQSLNLRQERT